MRLVFFALIFVLTAVHSVAAFAQWQYDAQESAFGEGGRYSVVVGGNRFGLAVRCTSGLLDVVYVTPDQSFAYSDSLEEVNATDPELLIRIDNNTAVTLPATLTITDVGAAANAEGFISIVEQLNSAKQRVAAAIRILGDIYHEHEFTVRGSSQAAQQLLADCPAARPATDASGGAADDPVSRFAHFWALADAIGQECDQYAVMANAILGHHLGEDRYSEATDMAAQLESEMVSTVQRLGCDLAVEQSMKLTDHTREEAWGG